MAQPDNTSSEELQLRNELEKISLDYQELLNKSSEMAPKDVNSKKNDPNGENELNDDEFEGLFWFRFGFVFKMHFFKLKLNVQYFVMGFSNRNSRSC